MLRLATLLGLASCLGASGSAQAQSMTFAGHLAIDRAVSPVLPVNLSPLGDPFDNSYGEPRPNIFRLYTTREYLMAAYTDSDLLGWYPQIVPFGADIALGTGSIASLHWADYTANGVHYDEAFLNTTGVRNALYSYNTTARVRLGTVTLSLDPSGPNFEPAAGLMSLDNTHHLIINHDGIYFGDTSQGNGQLTPLVTANGTGLGQLANPTAVNMGPDGLVYVLDSGNHAIKRYDYETGESRGEFALPAGATTGTKSLAISSSGRIYLDNGAGGGLVLNLNGELIETFQKPTGTDWTDGNVPIKFDALGQTGAPSYLYYDMKGNIFTYLEGSGIFMYHDTDYLTPSYLSLSLAGSMTTLDLISSGDVPWNGGTDITLSEVRINPAFDSIAFAPDSSLTVRNTVLIQSGKLTVASGTAMIGGDGTLLTASDGEMTKLGAGELILENANIYTGRTIVSEGTLIVDSSITGDASVRDHATLGGHGIIGGNVIVEAGGILSPGNSPGLLTIEGDLTLNDFSILRMEFAGTDAGLFDQLDVEGFFMADGVLDLVIMGDYIPQVGDAFSIFAGAMPGFDAGNFTSILTRLRELEAGEELEPAILGHRPKKVGTTETR